MKSIFLGHHPLNVGTGGTAGTNTIAWIILGIFVLIFIGLIYWINKKS